SSAKLPRISRARIARRRRTCFRYTNPVRGRCLAGAAAPSTAAPPVVGVLPRGAVDRLELLERDSRSDRDASQRRLCQLAGHLALVVQSLLPALQERTTAGEGDAAI